MKKRKALESATKPDPTPPHRQKRASSIQTLTYPPENCSVEQAYEKFSAALQDQEIRHTHITISSRNFLLYHTIQQILKLCSKYSHIKRIDISDFSLVEELTMETDTQPGRKQVLLHDLWALLDKNSSIISLQCKVSEVTVIIPLLKRLEHSSILDLKLELNIAARAYPPNLVPNMITVLQKSTLHGLHLVLQGFPPGCDSLKSLETSSSLLRLLCTTGPQEERYTVYYAPSGGREMLRRYCNRIAILNMGKEDVIKVKPMLEYLVWQAQCFEHSSSSHFQDEFILSRKADFERTLALLASSTKKVEPRWRVLGICKSFSFAEPTGSYYTIHSLPIEIITQIFSHVEVSDISTYRKRELSF